MQNPTGPLSLGEREKFCHAFRASECFQVLSSVAQFKNLETGRMRVLHGFGRKNPFVFLHGVAVGHAGEVIADGAVKAEFADALAGVLADLGGVLHVVGEQVAQELFGAQMRFVHHGIEIEILVKILAQFDVQLAAVGAVLDQDFRVEPDFIRGLHARGEDFLFARFDDVLDLHIDDGADRKVAAAFVGQVAVLFLHELRGVGPEANLARQDFFRE